MAGARFRSGYSRVILGTKSKRLRRNAASVHGTKGGGVVSELSDTAQPTAGTGSPQVSEAEARRVAEEARETAWLRPSFGKQLFLGDFQLELIHPYPEPDPELDKRGKAFCERLA